MLGLCPVSFSKKRQYARPTLSLNLSWLRKNSPDWGNENYLEEKCPLSDVERNKLIDLYDGFFEMTKFIDVLWTPCDGGTGMSEIKRLDQSSILHLLKKMFLLFRFRLWHWSIIHVCGFSFVAMRFVIGKREETSSVRV